jgi:hypothetical protein
MLSKIDITRVYETVLMVPGMNEFVKVDLKMSRKNVLLLSKIIERGIGVEKSEGKETNVLDIVPTETMEELKEVATDLLRKAGLSEMNEKLKGF